MAQDTEGWHDEQSPSDCVETFDPKFIIAHTVRSEVVDRLKVDRAGKESPSLVFGAEQRAAFLEAMLSTKSSAFDAAVEALRLRELPFVNTLRHLITPVLDDLGQMWSEDRASFVDVTLATCRVQTFICEKLVATAARDRSDERHGSIAFVRPAGENHTLGLSVVTECFRIDGWTVLGGVGLEIGDDLWRILAEQHVDVLGISIGSAVQVPPVMGAIAQARKVSRNRDLVIGIGGYCTIAAPKALEGLDMDFVTSDALHAIDMAASFLGRPGRKAQL